MRSAAQAIPLALALAAAIMPAAADAPPPQSIPQQSIPEQPGAAEQPTPPPPAPSPNLEPLPPDETAGVLGRKVRGLNGENMGMVVDVIVNDDGRPRAAVIDFGGFLGVGVRKIAVDWQLLHDWHGDHNTPVRLDLGRADVQAAPDYKPTPAKPAEVVGPPVPPAPSSSPPAPPAPAAPGHDAP